MSVGMKIHNFRIGFATNSSSSHSVVMIPPSVVGKVRGIDESDNEYGWDFFRLVSEEAKLRYLAAQLLTNFIEDEAVRNTIVERIDREVPGYRRMIETRYDLVGEEHSYENDGKIHTYRSRVYPSVDHQSVISLAEYNEEVIDGLIEFFKSPRVVVLGGNDNSPGNDHIKPTGAEDIEAFEVAMTDGESKVRVRREGEYFTFFNSGNGTKARFSFDGAAPDYVKSQAPELVDLKITNYCGKGCNFCYQSSTTEGTHAPFAEVEKALHLLAEMGVFEVAIGGGEPTDHPDFVKIIKLASSLNIRPNFTTLSDRWLEDRAVVSAVMQHVGGIGVSCSDRKGLRLVEAVKKVTNVCWPGPTVMAQHVLGSVPLHVTAEFLEEAFDNRHHVLLLGFKEVGFGAEYTRHDDAATSVFMKLAIDQAKDHRRWPQLSVDTALVDQYPDLTEALGVPDALVTSPEGKFSCYIDAVEGLMGPSSYVEKAAMQPLATTVEDFKRQYACY